ncbi:hypothetical protein D9X30_3465 [Cupriavidus sp. U2]|uniref:phage protein NinX family protein n=1 Tax=Cupriavidus sp. U2 TaxID=2920269 RepID=UPI00129EA184|nr:phage protein NinX family protein [Cupriavidus sp. U2]KAI3591640.1 hypothetical protein D9X30_3465 [Cupriavidus sp. U2]
MKVSELEGALLDYWVAKAEGYEAELCRDDQGSFCVRTKRYAGEGGQFRGPFFPSREWADGGPILARERIGLMPAIEGRREFWIAAHPSYSWPRRGNTPLIAAMRAYVASKFGAEVPEVAHG